MGKAGLKTFVYSFIFSLFTIFAVNSSYLRTKSSKNSDIKIPNKNITLFLKEGNKLAAKSAPVKKIALSILPEIPAKEVNIDDKIPLVIDEILEPQEEKQIANLTSTIPLEGQVATEAQLIEHSANWAQEKVSENFNQMIKNPPPVDENKLNVTQHLEVPDEEEFEAIEIPLPHKMAQQIDTKQEILQEPQKPLELVALEFKEAPQQKIQPVAQKTEALQKNTLLIPLEKNIGIIRKGNKKIEIVNKASSNQVALNAAEIPIKSMTGQPIKTSNDEETQQQNQWRTMAEKNAISSSASSNDPWEVAIGSKHPKNKKILENAYQKDEKEIQRLLGNANQNSKETETSVELAAADTVKNILIPIPEDIMKEENLTPQLISPKKNTDENNSANKEKQDKEERAEKEASDRAEIRTGTEKPSEDGVSEKRSNLLSSISSIFSGSKIPEVGVHKTTEESQDSLLTAFKRKDSKNPTKKILPTEIRLSFQPNRAEISGQTLKWIRAFASKTIEEQSTGLEIRIDGTSSPLMQQRRLNLLQNILGGEGVNFNKINTIFTSREPNSFIIRTVRINNSTKDVQKKYKNTGNNIYERW